MTDEAKRWVVLQEAINVLASRTVQGDDLEAEKMRWSHDLVQAVLGGELPAVYGKRPIDPSSPGATVAAVVGEVLQRNLDDWLASAGYSVRFAGASKPQAKVEKRKRGALINELSPRWPTIYRDLQDASRNELADAAKLGGGYWDVDAALKWAEEKGKLKSPSNAPQSSFVHRIK